MLNKQDGKCVICQSYFKPEDVIEKDHIVPTALGGKSTYSNLRLLHRHCHQIKTNQDLQQILKEKQNAPFQKRIQSI